MIEERKRLEYRLRLIDTEIERYTSRYLKGYRELMINQKMSRRWDVVHKWGILFRTFINHLSAVLLALLIVFNSSGGDIPFLFGLLILCSPIIAVYNIGYIIEHLSLEKDFYETKQSIRREIDERIADSQKGKRVKYNKLVIERCEISQKLAYEELWMRRLFLFISPLLTFFIIYGFQPPHYW